MELVKYRSWGWYSMRAPPIYTCQLKTIGPAPCLCFALQCNEFYSAIQCGTFYLLQCNAANWCALQCVVQCRSLLVVSRREANHYEKNMRGSFPWRHQPRLQKHHQQQQHQASLSLSWSFWRSSLGQDDCHNEYPYNAHHFVFMMIPSSL